MEAPKAKTALSVEENIEALLCYVLGWVTGIVFLALERENKFVRFHAAQSLAVFLPLFVIVIIISAIPFIGWVLSLIISLLTLLLWLFTDVQGFPGREIQTAYRR